MAVWIAVASAVGLLLGALLGWLLASRRSASAEASAAELRKQLEESSRRASEDFQHLRVEKDSESAGRIRAETELKELVGRLDEERKLLAEAKGSLTDAFKALASDALDANARKLLEMADQRFKAVREESATDLEARRAAIDGLVKPLGEALAKYQAEALGFEGKRQNDMGALGKQLEHLASAQTALQGETGRLANALQSNTVRGRWGELALRRIADLAGMTPHCDFVEQESKGIEEGGRSRPDMVIRLPGEREVILDAKAPLAGYLEAAQAVTEKDRKEALTRYAAAVKSRVDDLARKDYRAQFPRSADFVVLFLPNDSFLAAAAEHAPEMIEYAMGRRVVLATPSTLIALLTVVAQVWRQEGLARNAQEISDLGRQFYERMRVLAGYLSDIAAGLEKANAAYNNAAASLENRVLPSARRFQTLGAGSGEEIPRMESLQTPLRQLAAPEFRTERPA